MKPDDVVDGTYRRKRADAGHGVFQLMPIDESRFVGLFAEVGSKLESDGPKKTQQTAQVEWIRVGSNHDHQALVYVKDTELLRSASKHWPWA